MKHSVSTRRELTILKLEEEVFDIRHANTFRNTIESLVCNDHTKNLIIDFSLVKAIDSSGISSMLLAHQLSNKCNGLAIFVSLGQQIKDLLKLTSLDKQLYIFSSINEVMTLIEPPKKEKRGSRNRPQPAPYDPPDELVDEIDLMPDELFENEEFSEPAEEVPEIKAMPRETVKEESTPKKRGRPRKNSSSPQDNPE